MDNTAERPRSWPHAKWIAIIDGQVSCSAGTPQQLVAWLREHELAAQSVYREPEDEVAATGLAPL
jgi:hypothetical protein